MEYIVHLIEHLFSSILFCNFFFINFNHAYCNKNTKNILKNVSQSAMTL